MAMFIWDILFWEGKHEADREDSLQGGQFAEMVFQPGIWFPQGVTK